MPRISLRFTTSFDIMSFRAWGLAKCFTLTADSPVPKTVPPLAKGLCRSLLLYLHEDACCQLRLAESIAITDVGDRQLQNTHYGQ
jgi:hypothetical protein